jgi:hypothetical protein
VNTSLTPTYLVRNAVAKGKHVLLEGSQGVMLSVEYGTYPFVTSCDCSLLGLAAGSGLRTENVDYVLSVIKAYATRVGEGPFPTELSDEAGSTAARARTGIRSHHGPPSTYRVFRSPDAPMRTSVCFGHGRAHQSRRALGHGSRASLYGL